MFNLPGFKITYTKATGISLLLHGTLMLCLLIWRPFAPVDKPTEIAAVEVDIVPAGIVDRGEAAPMPAGPDNPVTQVYVGRPHASSAQPIPQHELLPPAMTGEVNETSVAKEVSRGVAATVTDAAPAAGMAGEVETTAVAVGEGSGSDGGAGTQTDASCQYSPKPIYPKAAKKAGWEGTVLVRVLIDTDGSVAAAAVREGSGCDILDEAAVVSAKKWRFTPAKKGGVAITSFYDIKIRFRLVDA